MSGPPPVPPPDTPFGPGDNSLLGPAEIQRLRRRIAKTRRALTEAQTELARMRYGPGPDNTAPVMPEVTRADGLWPFLLIRTYPGDVGQRPLRADDPALVGYGLEHSPDILLLRPGPNDEPKIVLRDGIHAMGPRVVQTIPRQHTRYDVWVHVWNLGQLQASGVRVRLRLRLPPGMQPLQSDYVGGTAVDLGDRLNPRAAHVLVKASTITLPMAPQGAQSYAARLVATADSFSDVASSDLTPGADRHTAHRFFKVVDGGSPFGITPGPF